MPCIIALDIETTGMDPTRHAMLEIGAVCVDLGTATVLDRFLVTLRHDPEPRWETRCLREFWTDPSRCKTAVVHSLLDRIRDSGVPPRDAIVQLVEWLRRCHEKYDCRALASDNVGFDIAWIDHYIVTFVPGERVLAYIFGSYKQTRSITDFHKGYVRNVKWLSDEDFCRAADITPLPADVVHDHRADHDAEHMGVQFAKVYAKCMVPPPTAATPQ